MRRPTALSALLLLGATLPAAAQTPLETARARLFEGRLEPALSILQGCEATAEVTFLRARYGPVESRDDALAAVVERHPDTEWGRRAAFERARLAANAPIDFGPPPETPEDDGEEEPFEPQEVTVEWSLPEAEVEPMQRVPIKNRPGTYQVDDALMSIPGEWHLRIDALIDDYTKAIFRTTVPIGDESGKIAEGPVYEGTGVIIATDTRASRVVVDHGEIKGYMAAMIMGFAVDPPALLEGLMEGDRVRFTIDAKKNAIVRFERIAGD